MDNAAGPRTVARGGRWPGSRLRLFTVLGFDVRLDISWLVVGVLVTLSLATGHFPSRYRGLGEATYWAMGALGAAGLFLSIVLHELCHSLVARRFGLRMKGITLFIFGGVAEMEEEPSTPRAEFFMALAGPASSLLLGAVFRFLEAGAGSLRLPLAAAGVLRYLAFINWMLAGFNLIPAYPLDGGRVLRSALWRWKGSLRWATRVAAGIGGGFGLALIMLGVFAILRGSLGDGIWWVLIGIFLRNASQMSYRQVATRRVLEGVPVSRIMTPDPVTVPPDLTVAALVEDYVYRHHHKMFPVVSEGRLVGCVSTRQVKEVPRQEWALRTVGEITRPCAGENSIDAATDAMRALSLMSGGPSRLMVTAGDRLVGVVTLKDLLAYLAVRLDLEGESERGR